MELLRRVDWVALLRAVLILVGIFAPPVTVETVSSSLYLPTVIAILGLYLAIRRPAEELNFGFNLIFNIATIALAYLTMFVQFNELKQVQLLVIFVFISSGVITVATANRLEWRVVGICIVLSAILFACSSLSLPLPTQATLLPPIAMGITLIWMAVRRPTSGGRRLSLTHHLAATGVVLATIALALVVIWADGTGGFGGTLLGSVVALSIFGSGVIFTGAGPTVTISGTIFHGTIYGTETYNPGHRGIGGPLGWVLGILLFALGIYVIVYLLR